METKMMSKAEIYNAAVKLRKSTGQGLLDAIFKASPHYEELIKTLNELVEEGKMKKITQHFSYTPDSEWWCITEGFCVEDNYDNKESKDLYFIRKYLNHTDKFLGGDKSISELIDESEELTAKYNQWVIDNQEQLDIMMNTPLMEENNEN